MLDSYELMERNINKCGHMDCKGWLLRNECCKRNIPPQIDEDADIYFGEDEETLITKEQNSYDRTKAHFAIVEDFTY